MNKKYIDNFYNMTLQNDKYESSTLSLPMTLIHKHMFNKTELFLKEKYNLLHSHIDVMAALYFNGKVLTPTELYDALVFSSGGMTKVLKRLESENYIVRELANDDKRRVLVSLTPLGTKITEEAIDDIRKSKDEFFQILDKKEKKQLGDILLKLTYSLS
ncbi:MAG: MarR family transcriptional regulator [Arcobacteraceae bacterium]|jgi:DNA-binding MarR family transcriptional regulator|nr:MarR family transcriptional regulator [Arcobacteraceae bacterium]